MMISTSRSILRLVRALFGLKDKLDRSRGEVRKNRTKKLILSLQASVDQSKVINQLFYLFIVKLLITHFKRTHESLSGKFPFHNIHLPLNYIKNAKFKQNKLIFSNEVKLLNC